MSTPLAVVPELNHEPSATPGTSPTMDSLDPPGPAYRDGCSTAAPPLTGCTRGPIFQKSSRSLICNIKKNPGYISLAVHDSWSAVAHPDTIRWSTLSVLQCGTLAGSPSKDGVHDQKSVGSLSVGGPRCDVGLATVPLTKCVES